jgi:hypothetical protein
MNRQDLLTRVRQMSDTLNATVDYPDALLKDLASMVHTDEWRKVLNASPYYRTAVRTPTLDASRQFAWSALSTGTDNDRQRVNRVLEMVNASGNALTYTQPDRLRLVNLSATNAAANSDRMWTRVGENVQTYGTTPGEVVHVLVNWTPTPVGDLSNDSDTVDWLEDWNPVLFYETAALALTRGGRETQEARDLLQMADMMRQKMLATVARDAAQPWILGAADSPWEWGG